MENKLGDFIIRFLEDKTETRKIIKCDDFFTLLDNMSITDDSDDVVNIIYYLEDNKIDINFHGANTQNYYTRYRNIERKVQMSKMLKGTKPEVQKLIEKVENINVTERPDWLESFRNDDEDESPVVYTDKDNRLGQSILDSLTQELTERINNEPGMTIEELQQEINNEINNN